MYLEIWASQAVYYSFQEGPCPETCTEEMPVHNGSNVDTSCFHFAENQFKVSFNGRPGNRKHLPAWSHRFWVLYPACSSDVLSPER